MPAKDDPETTGCLKNRALNAAARFAQDKKINANFCARETATESTEAVRMSVGVVDSAPAEISKRYTQAMFGSEIQTNSGSWGFVPGCSEKPFELTHFKSCG
jgi:hypothetical protein